tara:strand:- start:255 stop:491 length:237 start_codon:yes stop_codon:yes gene_type:complete
MVMVGIIGIDLITITTYLVIAAALVEVAIALAVLVAAVRITTGKHQAPNLFHHPIDHQIHQPLKNQEDKKKGALKKAP